MQLILAPAGNIFFGNVTDRLARRGRADAAPICGMIICAGLFIPAVLAAITPNLSLTWILVGWYLLLVSAFNPITLTALAFVTPGRMMGKVSALNAALAGIGGIALGPTLVAATSDYIFKPHIGVHSLGPAMSVVCGAFTVVLAVLYAILRRQMRARVAG
jgi:MFS family permease